MVKTDSKELMGLLGLSSESKAIGESLKSDIAALLAKQDEKLNWLSAKLSKLEQLMVEEYPAVIANRFNNTEWKISQMSQANKAAIAEFSAQLKNLHVRLDALEELDNERYIKALKVIAGKEPVRVSSSLLEELL